MINLEEEMGGRRRTSAFDDSECVRVGPGTYGS